MTQERWFIVSNRLPFQYDEKSKTFTASSGGLVTAIRGIQTKSKKIWAGALTENIPSQKLKEFGSHESLEFFPVKLDPEIYDLYYNGFGNDVLWPLFHYETESVKYKKKNWKAYVQVNQEFANALTPHIKKGDLIWIHDFHLFLLPGFLKIKKPGLKIGFFLHIPFPSSEIYKQLPVRKEILYSLIKADLIGFHDYSYLRHFCSSVYNILGISSSLLDIEYEGHKAHLGVFPVSIDTNAWQKKAQSAKTQDCIKKFGLRNKKGKVILGVDRLDYTKGIELKLKAFQTLLKTYPELQGKIYFLQIAVPSRTTVPEYIHLKEKIDRLVGKINGEFSTPNYIPVQYFFHSVEEHELLAIYRTSDVLFIGSKRDGMNLVCLEYIASQNENNPGVVVLSEFAGAISILSAVLPINPWDRQKTAQTLYQALKMEKFQKISKHSQMFDFLKSYTTNDWALSFMKHLARKEISHEPALLIKNSDLKLIQSLKKQIKDKFITLFIDYDGTLTPIYNDPQQAILSLEMKELLKKISKSNSIEVVIVSGRRSDFLKKELKNINVSFVAEHGAKFFDHKKNKWYNLVNSDKSQWYKQAKQIMKDYTIRTPQSFIEEKEYALSWHYRNSPDQFAMFQARKLLSDLKAGLADFPASTMEGKKIIEVRAHEANKGAFIHWYLNRLKSKEVFCVALGDDKTDEDLFQSLQNGITIKVGAGLTYAQYRLPEQIDVPIFLSNIFQIP